MAEFRMEEGLDNLDVEAFELICKPDPCDEVSARLLAGIYISLREISRAKSE